MAVNDKLHRNQGQAVGAQLANQPVQRRLVDDWSLQQRATISSVPDRHTIEPCRPVRVKLLFDLNTIPGQHRSIPLQYCSGVNSHATLSACRSTTAGASGGRFVTEASAPGRLRHRRLAASSCPAASTQLRHPLRSFVMVDVLPLRRSTSDSGPRRDRRATTRPFPAHGSLSRCPWMQSLTAGAFRSALLDSVRQAHRAALPAGPSAGGRRTPARRHWRCCAPAGHRLAR